MRQLVEIGELFQLSQIIDQPTRNTATSGTLIDVILTNNLSRVVTHGVVEWGTSNHRLVYVVRKVAVPSNNKHKYKNFNSSLFIQDLEAVPWGNKDCLDSPDSMWNVWKQLFTSVADSHAPLHTKRFRNCPFLKLTERLGLSTPNHPRKQQ